MHSTVKKLGLFVRTTVDLILLILLFLLFFAFIALSIRAAAIDGYLGTAAFLIFMAGLMAWGAQMNIKSLKETFVDWKGEAKCSPKL